MIFFSSNGLLGNDNIKALFGTRRKENSEENKKEKWKEKKIKNRFKLKILIIYVYLNSFYSFLSII